MSVLRSVLLAGLLLLPALPAGAATGITSPGAGEVVSQERVVPLRAQVDGPATRPSELTLQGPDAQAAEVVAVQAAPAGGELRYDFDTACARRVCTGRAPAVNGTWTLRLRGPAEDERTFVLRIPPAAPAGVAARRSEGGALVRWARGAEPDLTGFAIEDARGNLVRDGIGLDACDAEDRCQVEVPEQAGAWAVRAFRATCPDCREVLASPLSQAVGVGPAGVLPAAPPGTGAPPASAAPGPQPAARPNQGAAFARVFGGPLAAAPQPPSPASSRAAVPPQASGGFATELGYDPREVVVRQAQPAPARVQGALDRSPDRAPMIVLSVLLVAAAGRLRRWTRRAVVD